LLGAYEQALRTLSKEDQALVARGETRRVPGDRYRDAVRRDIKALHILVSQRFVPPGHLHVAAAHLCRQFALEGGLDRVLTSGVGNLLPTCRDGFLALGMPRTAEVLTKTIASVGEPYPVRHETRERALAAMPDREARLSAFTREFLERVAHEQGGFDVVADAYVSAPNFPAVDDVPNQARR
jgi:hypothetical protein